MEYSVFLVDGGYEREELWTQNGRRWLEGDPEFAEQLQNTTAQWVERDFGPELRHGRFRLEDVLNDAREMSRPRREPFYWQNARYSGNTQPVVGVNLWEAMAYCEWLGRRLRESGLVVDQAIVRLPTEWEWERIARGAKNGAKYPWGDHPPSSDLAHTRADGLVLDYAAPVGCFTRGATDHGVLDVAGNVWEWTASRALPPDETHDDERNDLTTLGDVIVRGGSWFSSEPEAVRCGYRGIDLPQNVYYDVGFRVVIDNHQP